MTIILFAAYMAMITMTSNAQSAKFEWARKMGGTNSESGNAIAVDSAGNVYTAGNFTVTVTFDPLNIIIGSKGFTDVFITKHDASGAILWAKQIGGVSDDLLRGIAVSGDYVYITGNYNQTCDFDPAGSTTFNITSAGIGDIFVAKYEASSGGLVWAKSMGGASADLGFGIAVDKSGNVYTTGNFAGSCDFDPGAGSTLLGSAGSSDIFISKLDKDGNFEWAKTMGGNGADGGVSIATDLTGNVYFAGSFRDSADFDPSASVLRLKSFGVGDGFVAKYNSMGLMQWAKQLGGTGNEYIEFITLDNLNNVITTGTYENGADFDPGTATFNLSGTGRIFVSKLDNNGSFIWAKKIGSLGSGERSKSVATDKFGSVYTVGDFSGTQDFDPNSGTANLTSVGTDVFISKLDSAGNYNGAYRFGGAGADIGNGIAASQDGNIYSTGSFFDTCDFDPSAAIFNLIGSGSNDILCTNSANVLSIKRLH
ncbi:MAG: SBBP repeat-containing protein [Bacteroidetes bacterium]|nr:SBBP repeat-containing protein [Bacteroidota bacterium]